MTAREQALADAIAIAEQAAKEYGGAAAHGARAVANRLRALTAQE